MTDQIDVSQDFESVANYLRSEYGFETGVMTSTLGGPGRTSYALRVFGPKSGWTNGIKENSPVQITIWCHGGTNKLTHDRISYELKNAGMKALRKTTLKNDGDAEKKLMAYFKKNDEYLERK